MRTTLAALVGLLGVSLGATLLDDPVPTTCRLTIELIDAGSKQPLPGVVQIATEDGSLVPLPELVHRGQGLSQPAEILRWWSLPKAAALKVPCGELYVRAFSGLESELTERRIDLTGKRQATLRLALTVFANPRAAGWVPGNTHLHLRKLSRQQSDRYLQEVPLADGLDIVYVSYLERAQADLEYTSNKYTPAELEKLATNHVHFGHGQEHRHNYGAGGEGYGHILLLEIPYIIRPVSIGPGITLTGHDEPAMQQGIDEARRVGGTVVWAHNMFGFEDVPNWLTGRVHANNIFDGGTRGSYKESFYRYLNVGLRVPFSTGTDWFIYDFSRVYVQTDRAVTPREWLALLSAGKTYITNGPLLEFTVEQQPIGSTIELDAKRAVEVTGSARGRVDFGRIELVQNGRVVARSNSRQLDGHHEATLRTSIDIDGPAWLALRTPPPPVPSDPELQEPVAKNEYGGALFAHTSPIYLRYAGRDVFDRAAAEKLIADMQANIATINDKSQFSDDRQRDRVLDVYREGIKKLGERMRAE